MAQRVEEDGGSKSRSVMERIRIEPDGKIILRASGPTSIWCLGTRESEQPTEEAKQMMAVATLTGAASGASPLAADEYRAGCVAKHNRVLSKGPFEMLERYAGITCPYRSEGRGRRQRRLLTRLGRLGEHYEC